MHCWVKMYFSSILKSEDRPLDQSNLVIETSYKYLRFYNIRAFSLIFESDIVLLKNQMKEEKEKSEEIRERNQAWRMKMV